MAHCRGLGIMVVTVQEGLRPTEVHMASAWAGDAALQPSRERAMVS